MGVWLLVLASAALRGDDDKTDPASKPDAVSNEGEWVWVPSSTAQQGESSTATAASTGDADGDADSAENQKNKEIWRIKEDVGMLRDAMQTLDEAYTSANQIAAYVGGHAEIMEDLAGNVRRRGMASLIELPDGALPDGGQDMQELDDSFDGLGALTDRVQSANQLLARQLQKIPDTMVAPSAELKLPKSAAEMLAGPSSLLQEDPAPDAADPEELAEDVQEKKMAAADQAELKQSFRGLDEMKEELSKKAGSLDDALGALKTFAKQSLAEDAAKGAGPVGSLVEHRAQAHKARAGHWEWRHHPHNIAHSNPHNKHAVVHKRAEQHTPHPQHDPRPGHNAGHNAKPHHNAAAAKPRHNAGHQVGHAHAPSHHAPSHHAGHHAGHHSLLEAPTVAGVTEADELAELDKALDPLEKITSGVKRNEQKMAADLTDIIAGSVEVDSKGNMRAQN